MGTQDDARDAPGSNVSHSDTTKSQKSDVALAQGSRLIDAKRQLLQAKMFRADAAFDEIRPGAVFAVERTTGEGGKWYLLVGGLGGLKVVVDGTEVLVISNAAPFAQACIGKTEEEEFSFQSKDFVVKSVM